MQLLILIAWACHRGGFLRVFAVTFAAVFVRLAMLLFVALVLP